MKKLIFISQIYENQRLAIKITHKVKINLQNQPRWTPGKLPAEITFMRAFLPGVFLKYILPDTMRRQIL